MEINLLRRETCGIGNNGNWKSSAKTLMTYEVMDGSPEEAQTIPIRIMLKSVKNLTPTLKNLHNRMTVQYWLGIVLFD